jgi:hypothetical protein
MAEMTDVAIGKIMMAVARGARGRLRVSLTIHEQSPIALVERFPYENWCTFRARLAKKNSGVPV